MFSKSHRKVAKPFLAGHAKLTSHAWRQVKMIMVDVYPAIYSYLAVTWCFSLWDTKIYIKKRGWEACSYALVDFLTA